MAFDVKKINPLDRQPRKAVGVNLPFSGKLFLILTTLLKMQLEIT